jgi:hypothetical protein
MAYKYFLYSDEQIAEKNKILNPVGKEFIPGTVAVGGTKKKFTQISSSNNITRFVDCKIIAEGEESEMSFTEPTVITKRGT